MMKDIGIKIRLARVQRGWTQQDLADRVNKTRPLISRIEKNGTGNWETMKAIYKVLGIDPGDDLFPVAEKPLSGREQKDLEYLRDQVDVLTQLVEMQKEVIQNLREENNKLKRKKR